jgi:hypothetical protein
MDGTPLQLAPVWDSGWGKYNANYGDSSGCAASVPISYMQRLILLTGHNLSIRSLPELKTSKWLAVRLLAAATRTSAIW